MSDKLMRVTVPERQMEELSDVSLGEFVIVAGRYAGYAEKAGGRTVKELDDAHEKIVMRCAELIDAESSGPLEQIALLGMVASSLLCTFDGAIDHLKFQLELLDIEDGADHD